MSVGILKNSATGEAGPKDLCILMRSAGIVTESEMLRTSIYLTYRRGGSDKGQLHTALNS